MNRRALPALALLVATGGCVPARVQKVPPVHGTLLRGAVPVAEAAVTWTTGQGTGEFVAGSVTDEAGRFDLSPVKKWEWALLLPPVHATARWRVDVREKDGPVRLLWLGKHYGLGPPAAPAPFVLACDLAQREPCVLRDAPDDQRYLGSSGRLPIE
ncbi:MAG: hypothetical protein ABW221_20405 [Vicinamibacteria bacterium]